MQDSLWKSKLHPSKRWDAPENRELAYDVVRFYLCPADATYPAHSSDSASMQPGVTSYMGLAGVGSDAAELPLKHPRAGFFGYDRRIAKKDIEDGETFTLVVIETPSANGPWAAGGATTIRGLDPAQDPYISEKGPFGREHRGWGITTRPHHPQSLLADGSCRVIPSSISRRTLEALCTIAGSEVPDHDW